MKNGASRKRREAKESLRQRMPRRWALVHPSLRGMRRRSAHLHRPSRATLLLLLKDIFHPSCSGDKSVPPDKNPAQAGDIRLLASLPHREDPATFPLLERGPPQDGRLKHGRGNRDPASRCCASCGRQIPFLPIASSGNLHTCIRKDRDRFPKCHVGNPRSQGVHAQGRLRMDIRPRGAPELGMQGTAC